MANPEHLAALQHGGAAWNKWRRKRPNTEPDLRDADLCNIELRRADLSFADFRRTGNRMAGATIYREIAASDIGHDFIGACAISGARRYTPFFEYVRPRYLYIDNLCAVCRVLR